MELREFWRALRRHWFLGVVVFVIAAGIAGYLGFAPHNQFTASATDSVEPVSPATTAVQYVSFVMPALQAQVGTAAFSDQVRAGLPKAERDLSYQVTSANVSGTGLLTITVTSTNRHIVAPVANAYAHALRDAHNGHGLLRISVLASAEAPTAASGPARTAIVASGLVLGLILAVAAALIARSLDRRRTLADQIAQSYRLRVLAEVPVMRRRQRDLAALESFMQLRTEVEIAMNRRNVGGVLVTSHERGEGKTLVAGHLASALAAATHSVTLVEADLRSPNPNSVLAPPASTVPSDGGLGVRMPAGSNGHNSFTYVSADAVRRHGVMVGESQVEYHPADLLSVALPKVAEPAEQEGSVVIVDGPPVHAVETKIIAGLTGWAIIVVDARRRDAFESLESTVLQLRESGTEILGVVLNRQRRGASRRHGRYGLPDGSVGSAEAHTRG